jgi:hypothetical protein
LEPILLRLFAVTAIFALGALLIERAASSAAQQAQDTAAAQVSAAPKPEPMPAAVALRH